MFCAEIYGNVFFGERADDAGVYFVVDGEPEALVILRD